MNSSGYRMYKLGLSIAQNLRPIRSGREVAKIMGISQQGVDQLACRALAKIAIRLRKEENPLFPVHPPSSIDVKFDKSVDFTKNLKYNN